MQVLGEVGGPLQKNDSIPTSRLPSPFLMSLVHREEGREMILEGHTEARKIAS